MVGVDLKHATSIDLRHRIDWPRGRLGYLPLSSPKRLPAVLDKVHKARARKQTAKIDLGKTWRIAHKEARVQKKSTFEKFIVELVDDITHEFAHAYEPKFTREKCGESEAQLFAMYGRRTRR